MPRVIPGYKEQARRRILDAAQSVFAEKGYHEARMEDIAGRVGVSKRTLYLYFKNKEDLFAAICAESVDTVAAMQEHDPIGPTVDSVDFARICEDFFDSRVGGYGPGSINESRLNFEIIATAPRNPTLKRTIREAYAKQHELLADSLRKLKAMGALRQGLDPSVLARVLIALYDGLIGNVVIGMDKSEVRKAWVEATRTLVARSSPRK
jgi:AcrR family transcriptional regulator